MISDALTKGQQWKTLQNKFNDVLNTSLSLFFFCLNQYLQVKCSFYPTCTFKQSMKLHCYIQTCWCDSAWSCHQTYIYNFFYIDHLHQYLNKEPDHSSLYAVLQPYSYTGSDDSDLLVSVLVGEEK